MEIFELLTPNLYSYWNKFLKNCTATFQMFLISGLISFFLGLIFGVMLMYCNLLTVPLTVFAIVMLHLQILQEERYLEETFGAAYREYKRHTFRYLGRR